MAILPQTIPPASLTSFSTALIQKKDADETDFSSVFWFCLFFSIFVYGTGSYPPLNNGLHLRILFKVKKKALGEEVSKSLSPGDLFVKIVRDELQELLGGDSAPLTVDKKPTICMMAGLQGSGKTTTAGKLSNFLRKKHSKKPLLVACDVYRPAAIDQLKQIGKELNFLAKNVIIFQIFI